jgi:hypothetical protein
VVAIIDHDWPSNAVIATKYQHTDALGSPVAVTNASGTVIERNDYEPYGAVIGKPAYSGIGYTGHVMDGGTGLTYMQQRYYDQSIGRFLSVDPVTANSSNGANFSRYWYANNNPYKFTDPDGRCPDNAKITECVESKDSLNDGHPDVMLTSKGEQYAKSHSARSVVFANKESVERAKAVVENKDGKLVARSLGNVTFNESRKGFTVGGTLPPNTKLLIHGHINKSMVDISGGYGDSQPPLEVNKPNVTITGDGRIGVREIQNGVIQHRMLRGKMTEDEAEKIQNNMTEATNIYNNK